MHIPDELKQKQRELHEGFPENLGLRVHRAISYEGSNFKLQVVDKSEDI